MADNDNLYLACTGIQPDESHPTGVSMFFICTEDGRAVVFKQGQLDPRLDGSIYGQGPLWDVPVCEKMATAVMTVRAMQDFAEAVQDEFVHPLVVLIARDAVLHEFDIALHDTPYAYSDVQTLTVMDQIEGEH